MAWGCVNVLTVACRHPASRQALIHTYQFLPPLSRLLSDNLIFEKKVKLLSLMQVCEQNKVNKSLKYACFAGINLWDKIDVANPSFTTLIQHIDQMDGKCRRRSYFISAWGFGELVLQKLASNLYFN